MDSGSPFQAPFLSAPSVPWRPNWVPHAQELTDLSALISSSLCSLAGRVGCPSSLLNWILTASWRPRKGAAC